MSIECIGCVNIKERNFPFGQAITEDNEVIFYIDTENCGYVQDKNFCFLKIHFCPVCGKKLPKEEYAGYNIVPATPKLNIEELIEK